MYVYMILYSSAIYEILFYYFGFIKLYRIKIHNLQGFFSDTNWDKVTCVSFYIIIRL